MKTNDSQSFGAAIRQQRKALGYTQNDISEATGLSASFISELENGKTTIELGKALKLANVLGLDCLLKTRGSL